MLPTNTQMVTIDKFELKLDKKPIEASKIDISQLTLKISKVAEISEPERQRMFKIFNKFKFVILECEPLQNPKANLLALTKFFGSVKRHKRSDENGIVSVENLGNYLANADQISATNLRHPLHTDGSFDIVPPKIVAMQCEIPSQNGGFSEIVYGESVYKYLKKYPEELQNSFTHPLTITRGGETATRAIFVEKEGRISITFRLDAVISIAIPPQLQNVFNIIRNYVNNPNNKLTFKLEANQIVLLDNASLLHGRTSFPDNEVRKLNRLWLDGISEYSHELQFGFFPEPGILY